MATYVPSRLDDLVIGSGQTESNVLSRERFIGSKGFTIKAPSTLPEIVKIYISLDSGLSYGILQSGGSDIEIEVGKVIVLNYMGWSHMKLVADGAAGGDRTFQIMALNENL